MEGLRTILLLIGAAVVAGVWWWSTRRGREPAPLRPRAEPSLGAIAREARAAAPIDRLPDALPDAKGRMPDHPDYDPDTTAPRAAQSSAPAALRAADAEAARLAAAAPPPAAELAEVFGDAPTEARLERGEPGPGFDPARDMILSLFVLPAAGERFLGAEVVETLGGAGLRFGQRQVFHRLAPDGASMYCVANMVEPGTLEPEAVRFEHIPGLLFFAVLPGPRSGTDTFADMIATARRVAQRLRGELADAERSSLTPQTIQHLRERVVEFERLRQRAEG
jgi:cell division protein ZipA